MDRWLSCNEMSNCTSEFIEKNYKDKNIILIDSKFANPNSDWNTIPYVDMIQ